MRVELHNHLDCGLSYAAVREIDPGVTAERYAEAYVAPPVCASLADFLTYTHGYLALLQTERALRIAVRDAFAQLAADEVAYAELRFAPLLHTGEGLSPDAVVACVAEETVRQIAATGVEAGLILCTLRHFDAEQSMETARLVTRHGGPVRGLDLAGDEAGYPLAPHVPAFAHVREAGLGLTVHAGEAAGPENVREALDATGTRRIGHGVRSIEDPSLVDRLRADRVLLEVCPASNVQTRAVPDLPGHPVDRLFRAGVPIGISTDARAITATTLTREYALLRDTFAWTPADLARANRDALAASFAPEAVRRRFESS